MMMINHNLLQTIASFGFRYERENLTRWDKEKLLANWWQGLNFFVNYSCFQGRRDILSERVYQAIKPILNAAFGGEDRDARFEEHKGEDWRRIRASLAEKIGVKRVGKPRDIEMVISTLRFVSRIPDRHMVRYSIDQMRRGNLEGHFRELQHSLSKDGIVQIGPKIAAFYLRDVVMLFHLEDEIPPEHLYCLQPVDTWVANVAFELGLVNQKSDFAMIQRDLTDQCHQAGVSTLYFNAGAWYAGSHAYQILLRLIRQAAESGDEALLARVRETNID